MIHLHRLRPILLAILMSALFVRPATAAPLTFEPLSSEEKCPGFQFELDGRWQRSQFMTQIFYLEPDKYGTSPISITGMPRYDAVSGYSKDTHKNAEKNLRGMMSGNGRNPDCEYKIVNLNGFWGVAEIGTRMFQVWVYEGPRSFSLHYNDGQSTKPDIARDVLAQICKTFKWKRQPKG